MCSSAAKSNYLCKKINDKIFFKCALLKIGLQRKSYKLSWMSLQLVADTGPTEKQTSDSLNWWFKLLRSRLAISGLDKRPLNTQIYKCSKQKLWKSRKYHPSSITAEADGREGNAMTLRGLKKNKGNSFAQHATLRQNPTAIYIQEKRDITWLDKSARPRV